MTHDSAPREPIATSIGRFAANLSFDDVPPEVIEQAKLLVLDAVGIALASSTYEFSERAATSVLELAAGGRGDASVIGRSERLPVRDAILLNGILVHGLDFDDTHPGGVIHASASAAPTALAIAEANHANGRDLLTAFVLGLEVSSRVGAAAKGGFHQVGFHPTGLVGAFGATVTAGRLAGLSAIQIAQAQGFVGSLAAGSLEFLSSGAWTKRAHPGWAGVAALTASAFARNDFLSPEEVYEGRYGLFASHLGADHGLDLEVCRHGLGEQWETMNVAVKPFPACHFTHAFADAGIALRRDHNLKPDDIASIRCLIAQGEVGVVCEPWEVKLRPRSAYDAQFSLPFVTAAAVVHGRFTLSELEDEALADPEILAVAARTTYEVDPDSGFPESFSGEVVIRTVDDRELRHREQVNRGAGGRPLSADDIRAKFERNAALRLPADRVQQIAEGVLALDRCADLADFAPMLSA